MDKKTEPTIVESETSNLIKEAKEVAASPTPSKGIKNLLGFLKGSKIVLVILAAIILTEVLIGLNILKTPIPNKIGVLEGISDGKIALIADKKDLPVGDIVTVSIRVSTGGHTSAGTDLVLNYNPALLEATGSPMFQKGKIYTEYPLIQNDVKKGTIRISGISSPSQSGFNGTGNLGTLTFRAKKSGKTTLAVAFKKDTTTDSNIIEAKTARDVLSKVYNLELNIGVKNPGLVNVASADSCSGYSQICWNAAGKQGTQRCQGGIKKDNLCVWDPSLTISCGPCTIK